MPWGPGLTDKQQRFVEEYTVDFNATQAAIRAGYSENSAGVIGHENLNKPKIADAIEARVETLTMKADEALIRLGEMARGSLEPFVRMDGEGNLIVDLSTKEAQDQFHLLTEVEIHTDKDENKDGSVRMSQRAKVKLHDAKDALKQILRVYGKFTDHVELTGRDGGPVEYRELGDEELLERADQLQNRLKAIAGNGAGGD